MGIAGGGAQTAMAEQDLNDADVGAGLQQMGGKGVAQGMSGDALAQAAGVAGALDRFLQTLQAEGSIGESAGKEPRGGVGNFPVAAQQDQEFGRQHEVTILVALALPDANGLAARINVTPLEMKGFRGPQAGGVDGGQQDPVLPLGNGGQETRDFLETQHFGQPAFLAGKGNVLDDPVLVKGVAVEEAQGADRLVKPTPGGFLLMGQKELVGADLFRS